MTCYPPRSTILQNFITLSQPMPEMSLTKNSCRQRNKYRQTGTVNDILPACRSACGNDKRNATQELLKTAYVHIRWMTYSARNPGVYILRKGKSQIRVCLIRKKHKRHDKTLTSPTDCGCSV